ncbi:MAG: hypothetical protein ACJ72N_10005 [Labedaea sp.]
MSDLAETPRLAVRLAEAARCGDTAAVCGGGPAGTEGLASIASCGLDRSLRTAAALRERPADEPLWAALTEAALEQFTRGPEVEAMPSPAHAQWASGVRTMLAEPALQGERLRAVAIAEAEKITQSIANIRAVSDSATNRRIVSHFTTPDVYTQPANRTTPMQAKSQTNVDRARPSSARNRTRYTLRVLPCRMQSPIHYETTAADRARIEESSTIREESSGPRNSDSPRSSALGTHRGRRVAGSVIHVDGPHPTVSTTACRPGSRC